MNNLTKIKSLTKMGAFNKNQAPIIMIYKEKINRATNLDRDATLYKIFGLILILEISVYCSDPT